jgi:5-methylcytosine-specific restriction endonuclease McrA
MKPSQVTSLDKLFSELIRLRANGFCEHCGHWVKFEGIVASHFYGRTRKSVRWDEDNVQGICNKCHLAFHNDHTDYFNWLFVRLGAERLSALADRAEVPTKLDYITVKTQIQNRIKELK